MTTTASRRLYTECNILKYRKSNKFQHMSCICQIYMNYVSKHIETGGIYTMTFIYIIILYNC